MSAYSDYKCGALPYDEFKSAMRRECAEDPFDGYTCRDCASHKDCEKQVCLEGYPQCDDKDEYFEDEIEVYEALQDEEYVKSNYASHLSKEKILDIVDVVDIQEDYREWKNEKRKHSNNN